MPVDAVPDFVISPFRRTTSRTPYGLDEREDLVRTSSRVSQHRHAADEGLAAVLTLNALQFQAVRFWVSDSALALGKIASVYDH